MPFDYGCEIAFKKLMCVAVGGNAMYVGLRPEISAKLL